MSAAALAALLGVGPEAAERAARADLRALLATERCGPLFIRLAFNDAGTFDARDGTGGANGSIRTRKELSHAANAGLERAVHLLAPLKAKFPALSCADLFQLAGVVAVEGAGGPPLGFVPGRRDSWAYAPEGSLFSPPPPPPSGRPWPASSTAGLRAWAARCGLSLRSAVALAALHPLARWWSSPLDGSSGRPDISPLPLPLTEWASHPAGKEGGPSFSNAYFRALLAGRVPGDAWLLADPETRLLVDEYASSEATLMCDYAAAHEALSRLGCRLGGAGGGGGGVAGRSGGGRAGPGSRRGSGAAAAASPDPPGVPWTITEWAAAGTLVLAGAVVVGSALGAWRRRAGLRRGRG